MVEKVQELIPFIVGSTNNNKKCVDEDTKLCSRAGVKVLVNFFLLRGDVRLESSGLSKIISNNFVLRTSAGV